MELDHKRHAVWNGRAIAATVLYSRAGLATQIWLEGSHGAVIVDCGDGCLRDIIEYPLDYGKIRGVVFTHGHFDHMGGLHSLLAFLRMVGRTAPLPVYAPAGCIEVFSTVSGFMHMYEDSIPYDIPCHGVEDGETVSLDEFSISATAVRHCGSVAGGVILDPIPACGYRVSLDGETVAVSGDTGTAAPLENLFRGADLGIIEATLATAESTTPEMLTNVHLTEAAARHYGELANEYILIHRAIRR